MEHEVVLPNAEFICPEYHERLRYFLATDIFDEDELETMSFIDKYNLSDKYRDYKLVKPVDLPAGFPIENTKPNKDGFILMISIRAMHRICCKDAMGKQIHFMFHPYLRWMIYDYDNNHGSIIKFIIHNKKCPIKMAMGIHYKDENGSPNVLLLDAFHIETLWNLDLTPSLLVYYFNPNDNTIESLYLDESAVFRLNLIWKR